MATNRRPSSPRVKPAARRVTAEPAARGPVRAGSCPYCHTRVQAAYNYCHNCGMPTDPTRDRPLYIVEGLSNLFNVVFFESLLDQELNRASRYGHDLSVLVAEIDHLQDLEASYGYEEVNRLIRGVGEVIATAIRDPDTLAATNRVAALGTHRFLVLLPETPEEGAFKTAEKIRHLVDSTVFEFVDGRSAVTVSLGVASVALDSAADANLLSRAAQALIESRAKGPNRVQVNGLG